MTIQEYTNIHINEIANERGWACNREGCPSDCRSACTTSPSRDKVDCRPNCKKSCLYTCKEAFRAAFCPRMRDYYRYISELQSHITKDMQNTTFDDVKFAVDKVREEFGYAESTVRGIQSCISVIYSFAEAHEGIYNIMKYTSCKGCEKDILSILASGRSKKAIQQELQEQRSKYRHKTKSLTIEQLEKLAQILWHSIEDDGRYCAIALMLYTGARPAEVRAIKWKDVVPFLDHPDHWILNLYKIADKHGTPQQRMKTPNAYRRIPLHCELMVLLRKRRDFVLKQCLGKDISEFPICCLGYDFQTPCRDYQVSQLTDKVFSSLKLNNEDMFVYMLDAEIEKLSGQPSCADKDQHLTLYVLRRAFWTWMESLTQLTDYEKRYVTGHDMKIGSHSVHTQYNDENRLWDICQKIDTCILGKDLHKESLMIEPIPNTPIQIENRGLIRIHLTQDMLVKGGTLQCFATTEEAGELLTLVSLSALRKYGRIVPQAEVLPTPVKNEIPVGVNCEYENLLAHEKASKKFRSPKSESTDVVSVSDAKSAGKDTPDN